MVSDITSGFIKLALMEYWRFTRQCLCADEVHNADIIVLNKNNYIHEIEVKCCKSDLCNLELKKDKHFFPPNKYSPHYFSFAVPIQLMTEAEQVINKLNSKYGLILIDKALYNPVIIKKSAKILHTNNELIDLWEKRIIYRLSSSLISHMKKLYIDDKS